MINIKNTIIAFLLLAPTIHAQEIKEEKIETEIESVVVYLDGAEINQSKSISVRPGKTKVTFVGLSPFIDAKSIRVKTSNEIDILSVNNKLDYLNSENNNPQIKLLKDSLDLVSREIVGLADEEKSYNAEISILEKNQSLGSSTTALTMGTLLESATLYRKRMKEINNAVSRIKQRNEELIDTRNRINKQLYTLKYQSNYKRSEVSVLLSSNNPVTTEIELTYVVTNAGWVPVYDIKAEDVNKPIALKYRAKIFNDTDIDWKNVSIKLSTADPFLNASKPELQPWYLDFQVEQKKAVLYSSKNYEISNNAYSNDKNGEEEFVMAENAEISKPKVRGYVNSEPVAASKSVNIIQVSDLSAEFTIKEKYSIVADGKPYFVDINTYNLPATYKHFTIPKKDASVFLLARVTGWEDLNLVSGNANIYFNDSYVGLSYINTASTDDTLDISLGRDSKVVVTREKQKEFSRNEVFGTNQKNVFAYEIVLKNNRNTAINVEILDQLPISKNSLIEVGGMETQGGGYNENTGELKWAYSLQPMQSKVVKLSFFVKYPKNKPVNLNQTRHMNARYM